MNQFLKLTNEELLECYAQWDKMQHHTGVCKDGKLREIIDAYDNDEKEGRTPVRAANEDLLEEIARRWVEDNRKDIEDYTKLRAGCAIWYVDFENGTIEGGKIYTVRFKDGIVESFSVDFKDGDFDEFVGGALGKSFFISEKTAQDALIKGQ